jgi:hypothetical protein
LGLVKPGPTGPLKVEMGALVEGLRSLGVEAVAAVAMLTADKGHHAQQRGKQTTSLIERGTDMRYW